MDAQIVTLHHTQPKCGTAQFGVERAAQALAFHQSFPAYAPTPLVSLAQLANWLGVGAIHVKDESQRFGLNAFKVLGGSYAIARYIAQRLNMDADELTYAKMVGKDVQEALGPLTFITATDGNHGRGVAWTARQLGQRCIVYMPKGSSQERLAHIRALGAQASITEFSYDDAVRLAQQQAQAHGYVVIQDTDWPGYTQIPTWIMQGYTTMALEAVQQLQQQGEAPPTHLFLQAGVGAMSGAVTGFFAHWAKRAGVKAPIVTIVEPQKADCLFRTAKANDGQLHFAQGPMDTIMAGLACGEPCTAGWRVLHDHADHFASVPEYIAADGMRVLGNPLPGDARVISGESGAVTLGLLYHVLHGADLGAWRERLQLDANSRILCISTEGDTDAARYRRIVWEGAYAGNA